MVLQAAAAEPPALAGCIRPSTPKTPSLYSISCLETPKTAKRLCTLHHFNAPQWRLHCRHSARPLRRAAARSAHLCLWPPCFQWRTWHSRLRRVAPGVVRLLARVGRLRMLCTPICQRPTPMPHPSGLPLLACSSAWSGRRRRPPGARTGGRRRSRHGPAHCVRAAPASQAAAAGPGRGAVQQLPSLRDASW